MLCVYTRECFMFIYGDIYARMYKCIYINDLTFLLTHLLILLLFILFLCTRVSGFPQTPGYPNRFPGTRTLKTAFLLHFSIIFVCFFHTLGIYVLVLIHIYVHVYMFGCIYTSLSVCGCMDMYLYMF